MAIGEPEKATSFQAARKLDPKDGELQNNCLAERVVIGKVHFSV